MTVPPRDMCGCNPMCSFCREDLFKQLRGVAQSRGEYWARQIADVIPVDRKWPWTDSRAIARKKVHDLTDDQELREILAVEVEVGAARWWNRTLEAAG